jgi:putative endonuclease
MVIVYALRNKVNEEVYVGITSSLDRRIAEHNAGKNRYTKAFMPWFVFYTEKLPDFASARKREKYLKSASGKRFLKKFSALNPGSLPDF